MEIAEAADFGVARRDGGFAAQEFGSEIFEGAGPFIAHGFRVGLVDQGALGAEAGVELVARVAHAAFEAGFFGANLREEDAAHIFDIAVGSVERELRVGGAFAFPECGRNLAGFVIDEETGAVGEEVDAIGAQIQPEVADVDVGEGLLAGFDGEGLAAGFFGEPLGKASAEAALFGGETSLLPGIGRIKAAEG